MVRKAFIKAVELILTIMNQTMNSVTIVSVIAVLSTYLATESLACDGVKIISRKSWGATSVSGLARIPAVSHVFIHHTTGGQCSSTSKCSAMVRDFQNYHMKTKKWSDIGYSFLIGGDGNIYEGRGWGIQGAHTKGHNTDGIGVAFIGDFSKSNAPSNMITSAKRLIACGVKSGKIKKNYKLHGHRDSNPTDCPGNKLYAEIQNWTNYQKKI